MSPLFFSFKIENELAFFDVEESRHLLTVLRLKAGDVIQVTDGQGFIFQAEILEGGKKEAIAKIISRVKIKKEDDFHLHIAIAPTKNIDRFEWFLEKATELGIDEITPMLCRFSERKVLREDRLQKILVSTIKQSQRAFLPKLHPLTSFGNVISKCNSMQKFIAWCDSDITPPHLQKLMKPAGSALVLIGPEGDFSLEEIADARSKGFQAVNLGNARLRTETAGVMVTALRGFLTV